MNATNILDSKKNQHIARMALLYRDFIASNDFERAEKLFDLFVKEKNNQFAICFTGHFSAGKSSMVNKLIGENILASSPIPTSANLVMIQNGTQGIKVFFNNDKTAAMRPPFSSETLKAYTKNGQHVRRIDIYHPDVPENIMYMDTPGIDSTDEAHMSATENALHLADAIFYMVEYNHVQSSTNFQYLKKLAQHEKPIYLIVNQIDKHSNEELSFDDYQHKVVTSLEQWHIHVEKIFFTSLKETTLKNDFPELKMMLNHQEKLSPTDSGFLQQSLNQLIEEHEDWLKASLANDIEKLKETASHYSISDLNQLQKELTEKQAALSTLESASEHWMDGVKTLLKKTVKSAILMPYETRELARLYIESTQRDFKVGLLFSKKKTEDERKSRLQRFHESLSKNISTLEWHIKDLLEKEQKNAELDQRLLERISTIDLSVTPNFLSQSINEGARTTGQYVLNYTEQVASSIQTKGMQETTPILTIMKEELAEQQTEERLKYQARINELKVIIQALEELATIEEEQQNNKDALKNVLKLENVSPEDYRSPLEELLVKKQRHEDLSSVDAIQNEEVAKSSSRSQEAKENVKQKTNDIYDIKGKRTFFASQFKHAAEVIEPLNGFHRASELLAQKSNRLKSNHFVIALFGAFSAGKSSFANALLGEYVLPVSPHPTTATINQVLPVTESSPHRTVRIKLKDQKTLKEDLQQSCEKIGIHFTTINDLEKQLDNINEQKLKPIQRLHFAFLRAARLGYHYVEQDIGNEIVKTLESSHDYIAKEELACYVESVSIYYDCSLTQQGVILVDTPGADSINARHTNVAFEYIKKADSILYVTYYNHAFSRADQEFLRQLGRVKDTFELDKMFFIVNAIDLAESNEEKDDVLSYVDDNLLKFGIRKSRLYGVSSLMALYSERASHNLLTDKELARYQQLKEKLGITNNEDHDLFQQSGMAQFKTDWFEFTNEELLNTTITSGVKDINVLRDRLKQMIETTQLKKEEKAILVQQLEDTLQQCLTSLEEYSNDFYLKALTQQIEELFFYVKKRLMMRYYDEFKVFFNPSELTGSRSQAKQQLEKCMEELIEFLSFDLDQEMNATSLRVEAIMKRQFDAIREDQKKLISQQHSQWIPTLDPSFELETPAIENHLIETELTNINSVFSHYKNAKQFFEGDGQEMMRAELEERLNLPIEELLNKNKDRMTQHYLKQFQSNYEQLTLEIKDQLKENYMSDHALLSKNEHTDELQNAYKELQHIVTKVEDES